MRNVVFSATDFELFDPDITAQDYEFFQKHKGAFKCLLEDQVSTWLVEIDVISRKLILSSLILAYSNCSIQIIFAFWAKTRQLYNLCVQLCRNKEKKSNKLKEGEMKSENVNKWRLG